jgi:hypothetical protein
MAETQAQQIKHLLLLCLVVTAAWLLSPALTAVHIEGYSAQLIGIADAFDGAGVAHYDPLMPLPTEFLYLTRFGTIMLLAIIHHVFGAVGDAGFKYLTLFSFVVLIAASVRFARAWGQAPIWASCTALLLLAGLPQISFYFNDNVVSAAFIAASLAILTPAARLPHYLAAGLLAGCGVTCRTDAIIALPMLFSIASPGASPLAIVSRSVCIVGGIVAAFGAANWFGGFNLLVAFQVGKLFARLASFPFHHHLLIFALFFNLLGAAAILCGGAINLRREAAAGEIRWCLAFVVLPALLLVAAFYEATNLRYGYPLFTPLFALHGGTGVASVAHLWRTPRRPVLATIVFAGLLISLAPPRGSIDRDGPQSFSGRIWQPIGWRIWQRRNRESAMAIDRWIGNIPESGRVITITTHFNDDFFLRQHLLDSGYEVHKAQDILPECDGFFIYTKGNRAIAHIRTPDALYRFAGAHLGALPLAEAAKCPALDGFAPVYLSSYTADPDYLTHALYGHLADRFSGDGGVQFQRISQKEFADLLHRATVVAATLRSPDGAAMTYPRLIDIYRARFLHTNPRWPASVDGG